MSGRSVLALLLLVACAGCKPGTGIVNVGSAEFVKDDDIRITRPTGGSEVTYPVTVAWETDEPLAPGATFLVLFDSNPMRPFTQLERWIRGRDRDCRKLPACPDARYLEAHHMYLTSERSLTVDLLPQGHRDLAEDFHTVTIVVLDEDRRRVDEQFYSVSFRVDSD